MKLSELLRGLDIVQRSGPEEVEIRDVASDSRQVQDGGLFVAVAGSQQNGHRYIPDVLKRNAAAIIFQDSSFFPLREPKIAHILVKDSQQALRQVAGGFFGHPYERLRCVGITGTNGKTTVSYLVHSILAAAGLRAGLVGTIGRRTRDEMKPLTNTTPGIVELHRIFKEMADAGNRIVVMEVSSHALDQERVKGIKFSCVIFTNLTQDHLDYHRDMETYFCAKQKLFTDYVESQTALVLNTDDPFGKRLFQSAKRNVLTYGFSGQADVRSERRVLGQDGSSAMIQIPDGAFEVRTQLVGEHNLYNILAAAAFGVSQGLKPEVIKAGIERLKFVPGRLERIESNKDFLVFVDYAHTDDALKNVLESLRRIVHNGRIITVFGCGGDRDQGKRPKMGSVVSALSDYCIVTSDNPRSEDPQVIIAQIKEGISRKNFETEPDRMIAIQKALNMAQKGDVVLIAGKGHETTQVIGKTVLSFDDKAVVQNLLSKHV
ncbi:MAG: UDP-N-acetylmuramoyl-L-alanyl-D-glutamate--2,6-diaminopimelate ligase [Candidatus Omnitrophota bacterium]